MFILLVKTVAEKPPVTLALQLRIYQSFLSVNWIIYRYLLRKVYLEKTNSSILVIIPSILIFRLDKIGIILISLNTLSIITLSFRHSNVAKKDIPWPVIITVQECPFSLLNSKKDKRYYLSTIYTIPKCLNACIIASSFSGVHCGCLAFSDFGRLKFSPTSSPHFFLIYAIYSEETLSPVYSNT